MNRWAIIAVILTAAGAVAAASVMWMYSLRVSESPVQSLTPGVVVTATQTQAFWMMGGCPCQGWVGGSAPRADADRLSIHQALERVEEYLSTRFGRGFAVREIMEFKNNFYAVIIEESTGVGAFELIIDPYTGIVSPEPGPNMMWNRKYGMHYTMMGLGAEPTAEMPLGPEDAKRLAEEYLSRRFNGEVLVLEPVKFYGYYTLDYELNGEVHGMLSVNGYTGDIWYHSWHGAFIRELELNGDKH